MDREKNRQELRQKLRAKIDEKKIGRTNKENKDKILTDTLKSMGIDKERLIQDLETMKKAGGTYTI